MASKITYDDKSSLTTSALPRANKCTDSDLNEIKQVVNENADLLDESVLNIEKLEQSITEKTTFSIDEQKIGMWLDKPLYKKVIIATTGNTADNWKVITNSNNINKLINIKGYMPAETTRAIPFASPYQAIWFDVDGNGNLRVAVHGNSLLSRNIEVCIEYTKSSD